jgi:hypothetical protein
MTVPTREECLARSREALKFAKENLGSARVLAAAGIYPQAFGMLLYAAEESTKASVYLYASLGLVTFDPALASRERYFCEDWLLNHPRKHSEFARQQVRDLMTGAGFFVLMAGAGGADRETVQRIFAAFGVIGLTLQAWAERFEEMRELAFHSGPVPRGKGDVTRPGKPELDLLQPLVEDRVAELGDYLSGTPDRERVERSENLPDRATWAQLVAANPKDENLWQVVSEWWSSEVFK